MDTNSNNEKNFEIKEHNFHSVLKDTNMWRHFDHGQIDFPLGHGNHDFLFGVATSTYQDSGSHHCPHSQWSEWEKRSLPIDNRSGASANLFKLYQDNPLEVIKRLQLLCVNTYRFSIEWSHLEPRPGEFNKENLNVYVEFCEILQDHQIRPFITLHHFSEPIWFHQMGSFEKEENISYFLNFCKWAFEPLTRHYKGKPLVQYFSTINEPGIEAYSRYLAGQFSPNLWFRFSRGSQFLCNILKAHCQVYYALKSMLPKEDATLVKIGITHQYLRFYSTSLLTNPFVNILNKFTNAVLHFFETGIFETKIPLLYHLREDYNIVYKPKVDFVGVQFYGRIFLGLKGINPKNKPLTTMLGVYEDPEGLFEAIVTTFNSFNAPVIISENGISTDDDEQRARYLSRALYAAEKARQHIGVENMLGYVLWSFSDNFEWFLGWQPQFGAYALTKERKLEEQYKPGVEPFVTTIRAWKETLNEQGS